MKHFSYFVRPGAVRLKLAGSWKNALGFKNADGSIVMVVANTGPSAEAETITAQIGNEALTFSVPAHSFSTLIGK